MNHFVDALLNQGVLDGQFLELQKLEEDESPNFVVEVVNAYFHESEKLLRDLRSLLDKEETDQYNNVRVLLIALKGSSSNIGAKRVTDACVAFDDAFQHSGRPECLRALGMMESEYWNLKEKLNEYFQMEQQRVVEISADPYELPPLSEKELGNEVVVEISADPDVVA